jgi:sulfite exporter TauE/SafE
VDAGLAGLLAAMLGAGLASSLHCAGMCGGIVVAFGAHRVIPVRAVLEPPRSNLPRQLAFNGGRIASYAAGGAAVGYAGSAAGYAAGVLPAQGALYLAARVILVLVGLQLAGAGALLARLEPLGAPLWRRVQPHAARLLAARTLPQSFAAGLAWGWLPCGMVYGALAAAALAGGPERGAAAMLAFGLGTLPALLAAGLGAARLRGWLARRSARLAAGALIVGFGLFGIAHASGLAEGVRRGLAYL